MNNILYIKVDDINLNFLQKDRKWLLDQLKAFNVGNFEEVLLAQYDSSGQLFVNVKNRKVKIPNIFQCFHKYCKNYF